MFGKKFRIVKNSDGTYSAHIKKDDWRAVDINSNEETTWCVPLKITDSIMVHRSYDRHCKFKTYEDAVVGLYKLILKSEYTEKSTKFKIVNSWRSVNKFKESIPNSLRDGTESKFKFDLSCVKSYLKDE